MKRKTLRRVVATIFGIMFLGIIAILITKCIQNTDTAWNPSEEDEPEVHRHEYNLEVITPTCVNDGYTIYTCECGESYRDDYIQATCSWGYWDIVQQSTALNSGVKKRACLLCGKEEAAIIAKKGVLDVNSNEQIDFFVNMTENSEKVAKLVIQAINECYDKKIAHSSELLLISEDLSLTIDEQVEITRNLAFYYGLGASVEEMLVFEADEKNDTYSLYLDVEIGYIIEKERQKRLNTPDIWADFNQRVQEDYDIAIQHFNENCDQEFYISGGDITICEKFLTNLECKKLQRELSIYFGVSNFNHFVSWVIILPEGVSDVSIDSKVAYMFEQNRRAMMKNIDNVLTTFENGSEEELVNQVFEYLTKTLSYSKDQGDATVALQTLEGNDKAYSTLFKLMLDELGIQSDICISMTDKGKYHMWNAVYFSDGHVRYYDMAMYEVSNDESYFASEKKLHTLLTINEYFASLDNSYDLWLDRYL